MNKMKLMLVLTFAIATGLFGHAAQADPWVQGGASFGGQIFGLNGFKGTAEGKTGFEIASGPWAGTKGFTLFSASGVAGRGGEFNAQVTGSDNFAGKRDGQMFNNGTTGISVRVTGDGEASASSQSGKEMTFAFPSRPSRRR